MRFGFFLHWKIAQIKYYLWSTDTRPDTTELPRSRNPQQKLHAMIQLMSELILSSRILLPSLQYEKITLSPFQASCWLWDPVQRINTFNLAKLTNDLRSIPTDHFVPLTFIWNWTPSRHLRMASMSVLINNTSCRRSSSEIQFQIGRYHATSEDLNVSFWYKI